MGSSEGLSGLDGIKPKYRKVGELTRRAAAQCGLTPAPVVLKARKARGLRHAVSGHVDEISNALKVPLSTELVEQIVTQAEELRQGADGSILFVHQFESGRYGVVAVKEFYGADDAGKLTWRVDNVMGWRSFRGKHKLLASMISEPRNDERHD